MILIPTEEVLSSKYSKMIPIQCDKCNKVFEKKCKYVKLHLLYRPSYHQFCSKNCSVSFACKKIEVSCKQCNKSFFKVNAELKKHPNSFCSRSCAATFNNTHKTHGCRKSKLEKHLESLLPSLYPNLEFHFNRKDAINSELDIYIPSLELAFELNGIFHYEPIYGSDKLNQIKNNDSRKYQACLEKNIELCIIDTSGLKYFKPEKCQKYLDIITNIINTKIR